MRRRGGGVILMIASIWGRESGGRMTYNAVKAAEISLAKAMSQQLARDNIRVNSVAPGSIRFPGGSWDRRVLEDPEGMAEFVRRELPFGRFGKADEVGAVVAFLASPRASWISGASVPGRRLPVALTDLVGQTLVRATRRPHGPERAAPPRPHGPEKRPRHTRRPRGPAFRVCES